MVTRPTRAIAVAGAAMLMANAATAADTKTIDLTTVNWAPFYGESLPNGGPVTALAKAAAEAVDHSVEVTFQSWRRAMALAKRGRHDGLLGAYHTEERENSFYFTSSFYTVKVGFIARDDLGITQYDSLRDLESYTIAYNKGWAYPENFLNAEYLKKDATSDRTKNIKKLIHGRVDLVAMSHGNFRTEVGKISNASPDDFVFIDPLLMEGSLHMAISKKIENGRAIARHLDEGLQTIRDNGTYDEIMSNYDL